MLKKLTGRELHMDLMVDADNAQDTALVDRGRGMPPPINVLSQTTIEARASCHLQLLLGAIGLGDKVEPADLYAA